MEKTKTNESRLQKLRAFLAGDTFKALLPFIGLVVIVLGMNILTEGKILTPKRIRLLLSQVYYESGHVAMAPTIEF